MIGFMRILLVASAVLLAGASHGAMADPINGNGNANGIGNGHGYGLDNGYGHGNGNRGAPLPIAGVGLPILAVAGIYFLIRKRLRR